MPGWGTGNFENEDAQNFLARLSSVRVGDLRQMLAQAADRDYLEARISSAVVAAAEVVAALVANEKSLASDEKSSPATPPQIADWIKKNDAGIPSDLVGFAVRAVDKVRTNSELKDLWLEAEGLNEWSAALRDLNARLVKQDL
jgi:hypothetical protein